MDTVLDLALRWLHILSAVAMAGGTFFWWFVLAPALRETESAERVAFIQRIRPRWARVVMVATLILLVTGLWNAVRIILDYNFEGPIYHILVTVKLLIALIIMGLAATLSGRSARAEAMRANLSYWLTVNALLATLIICLGGYMKSIDRTPKVTASANQESPSLDGQKI